MPRSLRDTSRVFRHHVAISRRRIAVLNEDLFGVTAQDKISLLNQAINDINFALSIEYARTCLSPNGRPFYRFIGLFDNDKAGRQAIGAARNLDASILEFKDVFRLHPVMPTTGNLDPKTLQKAFERENGAYKGLDWELEDLVSESFIEAFLAEYPAAIVRTTPIGGKIHRDLTRDGKARLHQFIKKHAMRDDLLDVIELVKALRFYMALPKVT